MDELKAKIEARVFKIKHEREDKTKMTLQQDLKVAAKDAVYKRNRSPDDGFQLVGDRRRHVNQPTPAEDESSPEEDELSISEMVAVAKKNAADLEDERKKREKVEKQREDARKEKEAKKGDKDRKKEKKEKKDPKEKPRLVQTPERDQDNR